MSPLFPHLQSQIPNLTAVAFLSAVALPKEVANKNPPSFSLLHPCPSLKSVVHFSSSLHLSFSAFTPSPPPLPLGPLVPPSPCNSTSASQPFSLSAFQPFSFYPLASLKTNREPSDQPDSLLDYQKSVSPASVLVNRSVQLAFKDVSIGIFQIEGNLQRVAGLHACKRQFNGLAIL